MLLGAQVRARWAADVPPHGGQQRRRQAGHYLRRHSSLRLLPFSGLGLMQALESALAT